MSSHGGIPEGTRIAHLIESDGPGGAEQVLAGLVDGLRDKGCRNTVFLPANQEGWLATRLGASGAEVIPYQLGRSPSPRFALWLARQLKSTRVRVAHSHEFYMAFYGACASHAAKVPHVITMHGSRYYATQSRRLVALKLAASLSGQTVAVSQPLRRALMDDLAIPSSRVRVILNGASAPAPPRTTLRRELGLNVHDTLIVSVANLYPVKGHTHLIEALALLRKDHPALHLALAGRGQMQPVLERQACQLGLEGHVHFLGLRGDIPNVLCSADLFVLASLSEGLPLALLEAMLAGIPAVATEVGEVPEVLGGGHFGLTVPPGDAHALASAIHSLLDDPEESCAMAYRAQLRARGRFSVRHMVDAYLALYGRLLERD